MFRVLQKQAARLLIKFQSYKSNETCGGGKKIDKQKKKRQQPSPGICRFSKAVVSLWDIITSSSQRRGEGERHVTGIAGGEEMGFWSLVFLWVLSQ